MAREQFQKDKKKSTIVILSLAASLSVFLCLITLIASQGPRTMVSSFMDNDLTILDDTVRKEDQGRVFWTMNSYPKSRATHPLRTSIRR